MIPLLCMMASKYQPGTCAPAVYRLVLTAWLDRTLSKYQFSFDTTSLLVEIIRLYGYSIHSKHTVPVLANSVSVQINQEEGMKYHT